MEDSRSATRVERLLNKAATREVVVRPPDSSIRWLEHDYPAPIARWNYHPEFEIHLIRRSTGRFIVGDHIGTFGPGHVALVGAGLPHDWISDLRPGEVIRDRDAAIQFTGAWVERASVEMPELRELRPLLDQASRGIQFIGRTAVEAAQVIEAMAAADRLLRIAHLLRLFVVLSRSPKDDRVVLAREWFVPPDAVLPASVAVQRGLDHIFENLTGTVRMAEAARLAGMSAPTFSRFFQRASGRTFSEMVRMLRVARARVLLEESDAPVAAICYDVGFGNLSNFNRQFLREVGVTPRAYRARVTAGR